jgi:hypothetical protein
LAFFFISGIFVFITSFGGLGGGVRDDDVIRVEVTSLIENYVTGIIRRDSTTADEGKIKTIYATRLEINYQFAMPSLKSPRIIKRLQRFGGWNN